MALVCRGDANQRDMSQPEKDVGRVMPCGPSPFQTTIKRHSMSECASWWLSDELVEVRVKF